MQGLELSRAFFKEYGEPMLDEQFPELLPYLAAGLIGSGSECAGFDDAVSEDHDFEPGFIIFLPGEDVVDRRSAFLLERAYAKLPKEYRGYTRPLMQPAGGARRGVIRIEDFVSSRTGTADGGLTVEQWLRIPEQDFFELTNGEIYFDNYGEISRIRELLSYFPEDIRRKKIAGNLLIMAQSGQYNFLRCYDHGETAAAQLAVFEFVKSCTAAVFLLNGKYMPYYKWSFRAMKALPVLPGITDRLEYLMTTGNTAGTAVEKADIIEDIASEVIAVLSEQGLTQAVCGDLEKHAYSVNDSIEDPGIRNLHVLAAV